MPPAARNHQSGRARQAGVTLTALLVGLAVGSLVLTATLSTYLMISEGARDTLAVAHLNQELRAALDVMHQDIRRAGFWDFNDANGDGDANADGRFDWTDLGLDENASGTLDTDADGDTDAEDLSPLNNPFQRRYGRVNNDLCIGTDAATGACAPSSCTAFSAAGDCLSHVQTGSCITYSYDLDADARIGVRACDRGEDEDDCPEPGGAGGGAPFAARNGEPYAWRSWYPPERVAKTKSIAMEMLGFRYKDGGIAMRVGRSDGDDLGFGCNAGRWELITSPEVQVTALQFQLTTLIRNANPAKQSEAPCTSGDSCRQVRSVSISLSGQLAGDPSTARTFSTRVAVRNDRYWVVP